MASVSSAIFSALQFSEAESALRPWWDNIEDYSVYIILILVNIFFKDKNNGGDFIPTLVDNTPICIS